MKHVIYLLLASLLASCGGKGGDTDPSPPATQERKPTILILFGAGFCQDCKNQFPEIQQGIAKLSEKARDHLVVDLFLVAGDPASVKPTQEMAEAYAKAYYPGAIPFADRDWGMFRNVMPQGEPLRVPAAVVADNSGNILKRWRAGSTTFVPSDIVGFVRGRIGE